MLEGSKSRDRIYIPMLRYIIARIGASRPPNARASRLFLRKDPGAETLQ